MPAEIGRRIGGEPVADGLPGNRAVHHHDGRGDTAGDGELADAAGRFRADAVIVGDDGERAGQATTLAAGGFQPSGRGGRGQGFADPGACVSLPDPLSCSDDSRDPHMLTWNDEGEDVEVGAVADVCRRCDRVRVFSVEEKMLPVYVLGVPVSPAYRRGRRRVCWVCGDWRFIPLWKKYAEWLSIREAERLPIRDIIRITNPELYDELEEDGWHRD
jgi:hypothetical protein